MNTLFFDGLKKPIIERCKLITALTLLASGVCITSNWSVYIIGVFSGKLLAVSMGYFINPLVSVLLGVVILRERLGFWQILAVLCAISGVLYMSLGYLGLPWISLFLAFSFALYGLLRKTVAVESIPGTFVESLLISPIVISFLLFEAIQGRSAFGTAEASTHLFLIGSGLVTALPIIWFANGARRIHPPPGRDTPVSDANLSAVAGDFPVQGRIHSHPFDQLWSDMGWDPDLRIINFYAENAAPLSWQSGKMNIRKIEAIPNVFVDTVLKGRRRYSPIILYYQLMGYGVDNSLILY